MKARAATPTGVSNIIFKIIRFVRTTVYLSNLAAKTKRLKLATGAVILPWNTPLRVVEKIALLDELSDGRVIFSMGRSLSKIEYDQFGIDMDTSRKRIGEAAPMVIKALLTFNP